MILYVRFYLKNDTLKNHINQLVLVTMAIFNCYDMIKIIL